MMLSSCGGSSNDFVAVGNITENPNLAPGTLTFTFARAQSANVPGATAALRFEFPSSGQSETRAFATSITLTPPPEASSVVITALDRNGFPLLALSGAVPTPATGQNLPVDLRGFDSETISFEALTATPANVELQATQTRQLSLVASFSNGETLAFDADLLSRTGFASSAPGIASVNLGVITAVSEGVATVTSSFTDSQGQMRSDLTEVTVNEGTLATFVLSPASVDLPRGASADFVATFTAAGGQPQDVTATTTFQASDNDVSFAGSLATVTETAQPGPVTITASYQDPQGEVRTASAVINVVVVTVLDTRFSAPAGNLTLPDDSFAYQLALEQDLSNGTTAAVPVDGFHFTSSNPTVASVDGGLGLVTTLAAGSTTITVRDDATDTAQDSFLLTVQDTTVTSLSITPDNFQLDPTRGQSYSVIANFANGTTGVDLTNSPTVLFARSLGEGASAVFSNGTVRGTSTGAAIAYTVSAGSGSDSATVRMALGYVTQLEPTVGGSTSGNVPADLQGVVLANATLTDGSQAQLHASDLVVTEDVADTTFSLLDAHVLDPLTPGTVGATEQVSVGLSLSGRYQFADPDEEPTEFTATVVSKTGDFDLSFANYPDRLVTYGALPRPFYLTFTNSQVSGFRLAYRNAVIPPGSSASRQATLDGYPALLNSEPTLDGGQIVAVDEMDNELDTLTFPFLTSYYTANFTVAFQPPVQVIKVGDLARLSVFFTGSSEPGSPAQTFDITDELFLVNSSASVLALDKVQGQRLTGVGTSPGVVTLEPRDCRGNWNFNQPTVSVTP